MATPDITDLSIPLLTPQPATQPPQIPELPAAVPLAEKKEAKARVAAVAATPSPSVRTARLQSVTGYKIRHTHTGHVFLPNVPSHEVVLDTWIENQIKHGILQEV